MKKKNLIIGGIIVLLVIAGLVVYGKIQDMMTFPTSVEAGISFQTIQSSIPENSGCLNEAGEAGLAKELINESLIMIGAAFGKTHSTILHACKTIENKIKNDEALRRQIALCRRHIGR